MPPAGSHIGPPHGGGRYARLAHVFWHKIVEDGLPGSACRGGKYPTLSILINASDRLTGNERCPHPSPRSAACAHRVGNYSDDPILSILISASAACT